MMGRTIEREGRGSWKKGMEKGRKERKMSTNGRWTEEEKEGEDGRGFSVLSSFSEAERKEAR